MTHNQIVAHIFNKKLIFVHRLPVKSILVDVSVLIALQRNGGMHEHIEDNGLM